MFEVRVMPARHVLLVNLFESFEFLKQSGDMEET